jgi:hypothetical protein
VPRSFETRIAEAAVRWIESGDDDAALEEAIEELMKITRAYIVVRGTKWQEAESERSRKPPQETAE